MSEKRFIRNIVGDIYDSEKDKWFEEDWKGKPLDYDDDLIVFLNEQQATINELKERNAHNFAKKIELMKENEQLKNELRKEKSLREYSDSMYGADLIVNIRFSNGEWKADVSVIDDE